MDRIPDRVEIQQSLDHRPDLRIFRPCHLFALPSNPPPQETEQATRHVAFIAPARLNAKPSREFRFLSKHGGQPAPRCASGNPSPQVEKTACRSLSGNVAGCRLRDSSALPKLRPIRRSVGTISVSLEEICSAER